MCQEPLMEGSFENNLKDERISTEIRRTVE